MGVPVIYTDFDDEDGGRAARGGHACISSSRCFVFSHVFFRV